MNQKVMTDIIEESQLIRSTAAVVIYSAVAVASSTVLLIIPNLETLSIIFFIVSYRYGKKTGFMTVITTLTIFEFFATQIYGSGGPIVFLLKFPPSFLFVVVGSMIGKNYRLSNPSIEFSEDGNTISLRKTDKNSEILSLTPHSFYLGIIGFVLTIVYDVITSMSMLVFVPSWEAFFISFVLGLPFLFFHQLTNFILFLTIPAILSALEKVENNITY